MILQNLAPSGGMIGIIVAVSFFLVLAGAAWVAFKALKKTAKMAIRMMVVVMILIIAVVGSISLWYFSSDGTPKLKPPANRKR
jgi:cytochrome bd-type quinol oxidase subunit 2